MKPLNDTTRTALIVGMLSGMRTNAGMLCTALIIQQQPGVYFSPDGLVKFFNNKKTLNGLYVSAAGEVVMDKLPFTPDRIKAGGLSGRIIAGAVCGAALNKVAGRQPIAGAIAGGVAAALSTFAFFFVRKYAGKISRIPDLYLGAAEDAVAMAVGKKLLQRNRLLASPVS